MTTTKCQYCGGTHGPNCPIIKAIEYFPNGTIKRIEYMTPSDYLTPVAPYRFGYDIVCDSSTRGESR